MKKLTYPIKVIHMDGNTIYSVVDFPGIVEICSAKAGLKDIAFLLLYDKVEDTLRELVHKGKRIPTPTMIPSYEQDNYIYITIPFERKEFWWQKSFLDCCIGSAVLSTILVLYNFQSPVFRLLIWLAIWIVAVVLSSLVSKLMFFCQRRLSFERVSLKKRLLFAVSMSIVAALIVALIAVLCGILR